MNFGAIGKLTWAVFSRSIFLKFLLLAVSLGSPLCIADTLYKYEVAVFVSDNFLFNDYGEFLSNDDYVSYGEVFNYVNPNPFSYLVENYVFNGTNVALDRSSCQLPSGHNTTISFLALTKNEGQYVQYSCAMRSDSGVVTVQYVLVYPIGFERDIDCLSGRYVDGLCQPISLECECNERFEASTNTCEPMAQQTEIDLTTGLVYAYPDNNHDDADRCPPILAVPESDNVCPASPQQSNASVGNNSASTGFPINCATGQKQYTDVDYQGFGLDALAYTRTYSTPNVNEPAVDGSANRAAQWLSQSAPALAKRTFDDGAELYTFESGRGMKRVFFKAANSSAWQTNGLMAPIELSFDNNQPTVQLANDQRIRFRDDLTALAQQDAQGTERFVYTYTTVNGEQKISRVANRFGRYLDYSYNTAGQLVALTDQDDVSVQYAYDNAGHLIKVIYPDTTPLDVSDNPSKTYLYEHPTFTNYVTGIVNQDGTRLANIAYDASGKATLSELHNGAERVEVSYPEDGKAVVKFYRDTAANAYREEHYQYGKFRGRYRLTQKQITQCDNCALTTESWLYNDRELLTRHTSPEGIVTEYGYDTQDRKVSETHGVGTPEASTTTYTWNDTHNQIETITTATDVTTYTFDVDGNRINTTVTPVQ